MATYTPRYNLSKPEATDKMQSFMSDYADNMDKIDENLGGGGGSANIVELTQAEYDALPDSKLSDDTMYLIKDLNSASDAEFTHVYGLYLDPNNVINSSFIFDSTEHSWTATADCILTGNMVPHDGSTAYYVRLDGVQVFAGYSAVEDPFVYVKKGQVVTYRGKSGSSMKAYGVVAGSEVTFLSEYASACYSTTEREVGCWVDGKPLYQRTISFTVGSSGTYNTYDTGIQNPENILINFDASFYVFSASFIVGIEPYVYSGSAPAASEIMIAAAISSNKIRLDYRNGADVVGKTAYITLQYTKTTDVAGSGQWTPMAQPAHHYSTTEQVVGTWVDGKPVYETSFPITSTVTFTSNSWVDMGINQGDMYKIIDGKLIMDYQGAYSFQNLQFGWISNKLVGNSFRNFEVEANHGYVVLQYTKSTD